MKQSTYFSLSKIKLAALFPEINAASTFGPSKKSPAIATGALGSI